MLNPKIQSGSESTVQHRENADDIVASCAIITCSDTRTQETDSSGRLIKTVLEENGHRISDYRIIKDDPDLVRSIIGELHESGIDSMMINGGTGIARRDVTFDVVASVVERTIPGFGELFRMLSYEEVGAASMLSRAMAGTIGRTLIFSMPGSTNAVGLAMHKLIIPELRHLIWELRR